MEVPTVFPHQTLPRSSRSFRVKFWEPGSVSYPKRFIARTVFPFPPLNRRFYLFNLNSAIEWNGKLPSLLALFARSTSNPQIYLFAISINLIFVTWHPPDAQPFSFCETFRSISWTCDLEKRVCFNILKPFMTLNTEANTKKFWPAVISFVVFFGSTQTHWPTLISRACVKSMPLNWAGVCFRYVAVLSFSSTIEMACRTQLWHFNKIFCSFGEGGNLGCLFPT